MIHSGCIGGTQEEATKYFAEEEEAMRQTKAIKDNEALELVRLKDIESKYNDIINAEEKRL